MTNVSLLVYLLVCPFNLKYVLDFPSYVHEMYRREECKDLSTHYRKRGIDVYSQQSQAYVPHSEEHLYEDAEIYFEIILRSKKDIRKNQKENYDKVVNSFVSDKKEYSLKSIHSSEEVIELYYVHVFTNRIIKIKIEKKKEIKNYLHLFFTNYCIYKLSNHDYNRVKNVSDHSKGVILNTYYIYTFVLLFSLCIYVEKSLLIAFPSLRKHEIGVTLCVLFVPSILFLYFYFYFTLPRVVAVYVILYLLFSLRRRKVEESASSAWSGKHASEITATEGVTTPGTAEYEILLNMRLVNMCITYLCIFGVDFFFFPKHFAKSAYYGNTLMDLGVGACISTSAYAMSRKVFKCVKRRRKIIEIKHIILFSLGIARFLAIKLFKYNYSLTEYGIHWNFFLTLCFTFVISNILLILLNGKKGTIFLISMISIFFYELCIYQFDVHNYLLSERERSNIFSQNREGIFNAIGSINLYLFSHYLWGVLITYRHITIKVPIQFFHNIYKVKKRYYTVHFSIILFAASLSFYIFHLLLNSIGNYSVRILCNANYIFVTTSVSLYASGLSYFVEENILSEKINITILEKINNNTLIVFLFCNVLLGFYNILFQPLLYPLIFVIMILISYSFFLLTFASFLPTNQWGETVKRKCE
ncbi:GPI-anchored wall transfer protein 1, putative [Plasmodium ovale]|uniref:GPI-anchored wall transfer protein 1, putative n=1 Tax=Plasmodium ovale TaxID=36330 RepID=A0A1C3KUC1_PLAOA|nr:GPI-anchored wall transfer protein 1, putative [Plasmodium ovale]